TFARTVALVKRYRKMLDNGAYPNNNNNDSEPSPPRFTSIQSPLETPAATHPPTTDADIDASVARDKMHLKPPTPEAEAESTSQPIFRIPERNNPFSPSTTQTTEPDPPSPPASSSSSSEAPTTHSPLPPPPPLPAPPSKPSSAPDRKVIFATGGITTGAQAVEVLAAGADVAQVYTALVYGGIGTVSKIKEEMRGDLRRRKQRQEERAR
ncbi:MAG: hypothetical protein LQ345_003823, partial [Seirophora villosa]